jgi:hypothetical protein
MTRKITGHSNMNINAEIAFWQYRAMATWNGADSRRLCQHRADRLRARRDGRLEYSVASNEQAPLQESS